MRLSFVSTRQSQNVQNTLQKHINLPIKSLFIGRGQAIVKKLTKQSEIIDLINLDPSISKVHASLTFSPAWLNQIPFKQSFMSRICCKSINSGQKTWRLSILPQQLIKKIYQYWKPRKHCLLRDLNSSLGTYLKFSSIQLREGMKIIWGDNRQLQVIKLSNYGPEELLRVISQQEQTGCLIRTKAIISCFPKHSLFSLLKIRHLNTNFLLIGKQSEKYVVGRGKTSDIIINHRQISRKQAIIVYQGNKWIIKDGNGLEASLNGSYLKIQQKTIEYTENYVFKMGRTVISIDFSSYIAEQHQKRQDNSLYQSQLLEETFEAIAIH